MRPGEVCAAQASHHTATVSLASMGKPFMCAQALETEEARAARTKRVAEALSSYKKKAGLLVDPAAEAAAQEAFRRGQELMHKVRGVLAAAKHVQAVFQMDILPPLTVCKVGPVDYCIETGVGTPSSWSAAFKIINAVHA